MNSSTFRKGWRLSRGILRVLPATLARGLLTAAAIAAFLVACGLPTIPYLAPPQNADSSGLNEETRVVTFEHNPDNDGDDFQGYELYYKLYTVDQRSQIDADANYIATTPVEPGPGRLQQRGFVRAVAVSERLSSTPYSITEIIGDDQLPQLPTTPTASLVTYSLDLSGPFAADPDADLIVTWDQGGGRARGFRRRSVQSDFAADPRNSLDSFWAQTAYDPTDWDIQQMGLDDEIDQNGVPDRFVTIWYAIAYGVDGTSFSGYYSEPLRLDDAVIVLQ